MYRSKLDIPAGTGPLVVVGRYIDPVQAQMARARIAAEGIEVHVIESASFNPMLNGVAGGSQLQVREGDLARVEPLLDERPGEGARDDGEGVAVRCPRCELTYCFHESVRLEGESAGVALAFFLQPLLLLVPVAKRVLPKRWHCHKCGHAWDDAKEGPAEMTKLAPDDPRPIFRLRRRHAGMGLLLGVVAGFLGWTFGVAGLPADLKVWSFLFLVVGAPLGWLIGRALTYDLCSEPGCRTPLLADREDCPRCKGDIAGVIDRAEEHYSASADFRRELALLHARDAKRKLGKKKKASA